MSQKRVPDYVLAQEQLQKIKSDCNTKLDATKYTLDQRTGWLKSVLQSEHAIIVEWGRTYVGHQLVSSLPKNRLEMKTVVDYLNMERIQDALRGKKRDAGLEPGSFYRSIVDRRAKLLINPAPVHVQLVRPRLPSTHKVHCKPNVRRTRFYFVPFWRRLRRRRLKRYRNSDAEHKGSDTIVAAVDDEECGIVEQRLRPREYWDILLAHEHIEPYVLFQTIVLKLWNRAMCG